RQEDDRRGSEQGIERSRRRRAERHPRLFNRGTGLDRLQRQRELVDPRRAIYESDGWRLREGPFVVRQRMGQLGEVLCWVRKEMGLREPLRRPSTAAGEEGTVAGLWDGPRLERGLAHLA